MLDNSRRMFFRFFKLVVSYLLFFFFQAEDGIRDHCVTGVQTCALPILRYQQVVELRGQGVTAKDIARRLDLSERTVQRWLAAGTFPDASHRRKRQSSFDAFAPYILSRWQSGERNGLVLWREIKEQGYTGSERMVYRYLETLKQAEVKTSAN